MAKPVFQWEDPLLLSSQLTEEERMVQDAARAYCEERLMPRVLEAFRHEKLIRPFSVKWVSWVCWARPFLRNSVAPA
jgi:hypothetical protein